MVLFYKIKLMTDLKDITNEIIDFTGIIRQTFPELYESLDETPLFLSYKSKQDIINDYKRYLGFLRSQFIELVKVYESRKHENDVT
jgi:hypothetical protein